MTDDLRQAAERIANYPVMAGDVILDAQRFNACREFAKCWLAANPGWTDTPSTEPGWYWSLGVTPFGPEPEMIRCRVAAWVDPKRKDLEWVYPDGSGGTTVVAKGLWCGPLKPPALPLNPKATP